MNWITQSWIWLVCIKAYDKLDGKNIRPSELNILVRCMEPISLPKAMGPLYHWQHAAQERASQIPENKASGRGRQSATTAVPYFEFPTDDLIRLQRAAFLKVASAEYGANQ